MPGERASDHEAHIHQGTGCKFGGCVRKAAAIRELQHEQPHLFTFLNCPWIPATNNFIEAAIRPIVVARKTRGGNRTWNGARTQQILASVLRTCWQQGKDAFQQFATLLRSSQPVRLNLVPAFLSP